MARPRGPSPFDVLAGFFAESQHHDQYPRPADAVPKPVRTEAAPRTIPATAIDGAPQVRREPTPSAKPISSRPKAKKWSQQKAAAAFSYPSVKPSRLTPTLNLKPKAAPPPKPSGPEHLTGEAAQRFVLDRVDLNTLNARIVPPVSISTETSAAVARLVGLGAAILKTNPHPDPMGYRVGLDFGTSATKVVLCSDAADVDYAMPTPPELQVDEEGRLQEHLWRTCVWFDQTTKCFQLTPSPSTQPILGFKTGLIQGDGNRMLHAGITHNAAATAFLALLIAYIVGADARRFEGSGGSIRRYSRFHIGVPVPSLEEDPRVEGFHRVVQAAFALAPNATTLRLDDIRAALQRELNTTETEADTPYQLFEELAGVVAGYMLTPERAGGPHIVVDVGAATLDVATFHIPDGEYPLEVYETDVALLGAQALECAIAAAVPEQTFSAACQAHTSSVLSKTFRTKNYTFLPGKGGPSKPMIYVGGGRLTPLHQAVFNGYADAYVAPRRSPEVDRWLERDLMTDPGRLLLAWGLAQDPAVDGIPRIRPPSKVTPTLQKKRDWEGGYAGAEVC